MSRATSRTPSWFVRRRATTPFDLSEFARQYGGQGSHTREQRLLDEARRADLVERGWTFIVLHAEDLHETPDQTVDRLYAELRGHGIPVPAVLDEDWRRHFPVRALTA